MHLRGQRGRQRQHRERLLPCRPLRFLVFENVEGGQRDGADIARLQRIEGAGAALCRRDHRVGAAGAIAFGVLHAEHGEAQQGAGMGREVDALHAFLQLQLAARHRCAPLAVAVTQVHLVVAHLAVLPVLVVARGDVDAIDQLAFAETDRPLVGTGEQSLVADAAEPGAGVIVERILQRIARFFGRAVDRQQAVGR